jgi:SUMO ligase MMS21 Smc5/6 complex component
MEALGEKYFPLQLFHHKSNMDGSLFVVVCVAVIKNIMLNDKFYFQNPHT